MKTSQQLLRVYFLLVTPLMLSPMPTKAQGLTITYNVSQNQSATVGTGFTVVTFTGSITNSSAAPILFQTSGGPVPFEPYVASFTGGIAYPGITLAPGASTGNIDLAIVTLNPFDPSLTYPGSVKIVLVAIDPKTGNTLAENDASIEVFHQKPNLLVDDDRVQCPTASFTTIQDAVNAAQPGDVIHVCPGNYREQVVVEKSVTISADNGVVLSPNSMVANAIGVSADPLAAAILARNAGKVNLEGLIIDGTNNGITGCSPRLVGILYQNASGHVEHNAIRHMKLAPSLSGCHSGDAVLVQSLNGAEARVEIRNNSADNYQKNGITGNEIGTEIIVHGNTVTGLGPKAGAAQNGIQVGFGAKGELQGNTVTGHVWSPCVSIQVCQSNAVGILIFQSDGVRVENNSIGTNQVGIFAGGNNTKIEENRLFNSLVLDGIDLAGDNNIVSENQITRSDKAAVFIQGNHNKVLDNRITDASIGILEVSGTAGNVHFGNHYFATLVRFQDPAPMPEIKVSPVR